MTYNKKTWESGQKLTAVGLNNIQNGLAAVAAAQDNAQVNLPVVFFNLGDITDEAESEDGFNYSRFTNLFNQGKNIIINVINSDLELTSLFTFKSVNIVNNNRVMIFNYLNANLNVNDPNAETQSTASEIVNNELVFNFDSNSHNLQSITLNIITYNLTTSTASSQSSTLWSLNPITTEDPENPEEGQLNQ